MLRVFYILHMDDSEINEQAYFHVQWNGCDVSATVRNCTHQVTTKQDANFWNWLAVSKNGKM